MNCDLNPALELGYVDAGSRSAACYERELARVTAQRDAAVEALRRLVDSSIAACDVLTDDTHRCDMTEEEWDEHCAATENARAAIAQCQETPE